MWLKAHLTIVMFVFLTLCLIWGDFPDREMFVLALLATAICGYIILNALLSADDCYVIPIGKERCKIWVYENETSATSSIFFKAESWEKRYDASSYDKEIFSGKKEAFLFFEGFDWYLANKHHDELQNIGLRDSKCKYVFSQRKQDNNKLVLNLLNGDNFETVKVDECITENICIP